jgi:malonate-semialdehyde dehydrogenase (acetylating)/methylmalonate-semialdehyde dehydrogenase
LLEAIEAGIRRVRPGIEMGPVISPAARDRIVEFIGTAEREGACVRVDGRGIAVPGREGGYFVGPTLIDRLDPGSSCVREEIFGPVLSVVRAGSLDEAVAIENRSPYGNAASIYTSNGATARHFESRAHAAMIGVNIGVPVPRDPFSFGGWHQSKFGVGDITGRDAIDFWTRKRKTTVKWGAHGSNWMT